MQYPDSLPLNDKEVVLIFDDGPSPRYSNEILDILASQTGQLRDLARELRSLGQYVFSQLCYAPSGN